jgi:hypothetical protein
MTTTLRQRFQKEDKFNDYLLYSSTFRTLLAETLGIDTPHASKSCREVCLFEFDPYTGKQSDRCSLRADIVYLAQTGYVLVESQLTKSDKNHRDRLSRYLNTTQWQNKADFPNMERIPGYGSCVGPDNYECLVWVAESFRDCDIDAIREEGLPIACIQATPHSRSVKFELIHYLPRLQQNGVDATAAQSFEPMWG